MTCLNNSTVYNTFRMVMASGIFTQTHKLKCKVTCNLNFPSL